MSEGLTRIDYQVYEALCQAASDGAPCPMNLDLEEMFGYSSASQGARLIRRLEERNMIRVERYQRFRRVQIVETGKWTAFADGQRSYGAHVPRGARQAGVGV